jgi:AmmeMemoRadiSam system protein B
MPLPALRNLDVSPITQDGETFLCLQDREGIVEDPAALSPLAFFIAAQLDGINEVSDIQCAFANETSCAVLSSKDIMKVVDFLDNQGFLETEKYENKRKALLDSYRSAPTRAAYLAGKSYPEEAAALSKFLDEFGDWNAPDSEDLIKGLIAPHIDFQRGGATYVPAYAKLKNQKPPRTALVFGIAHAGTRSPYILTRKAYDTPFGTIQADVEAIDFLADGCAWDPYEDELLHRTEHSIEFQAVMLARLYGPSIRIIPVLCGSLEMEFDDGLADFVPGVPEFLERCHDLASSKENGNMLVVAGADLAHVGRRFGDSFDIDDEIIAAVEARDAEDLNFAAKGDADAFYVSVMKDGNSRRVCGLAAIYSTLKALDGNASKGEIISYDHAPDPAGGIVSFAGITFA